jgi:hypothetical protein
MDTLRRFGNSIGPDIPTILAGIALVVVGALLSAEEGTLADSGPFFTFLGGVVVSWALTRAHVTSAAERELALRMQAPVNQALNATGAIREALHRFEGETITSETASLLIRQSNESLMGATAEIQSISGASFDPKTFLDKVA